MKIRVRFPKIHCVDDQAWEWGKDEIYFVAFPTLLKRDASGVASERPLGGALSKIREKLKTGDVYEPEFVFGGSSFEIESEDAEGVMLLLCLYECDSGGHYEELRRRPELSRAPVASTDWGTLSEYVPSDASLKSVFGAVFKLAYRAFKHFAKDDLIARHPVPLLLDRPETFGLREFRFEGAGAKYRLTLESTRVD